MILIIYSFIDTFTKWVARVRQCVIIVRDANRIHHFYPDGHCSCGDVFLIKRKKIYYFF
jgi:hypothetical protein